MFQFLYNIFIHKTVKILNSNQFTTAWKRIPFTLLIVFYLAELIYQWSWKWLFFLKWGLCLTYIWFKITIVSVLNNDLSAANLHQRVCNFPDLSQNILYQTESAIFKYLYLKGSARSKTLCLVCFRMLKRKHIYILWQWFLSVPLINFMYQN
jgi:hypothetical protein